MSARAMLTALVPLAVTGALAAPAPALVRVYYPTRVGTELVYETTENGAKSQQKLVVTKVESEDGAKTVLESADGGTTVYQVMRVSGQGVYRLQFGPNNKSEPPLLMLKLPHQDGQKWQFDTLLFGVRHKGTCTARGIERLTVPAGTFSAIRVEVDSSTNGRPPSRGIWWFAADVGLVKVAQGKDFTSVLQAFIPGK